MKNVSPMYPVTPDRAPISTENPDTSYFLNNLTPVCKGISGQEQWFKRGIQSSGETGHSGDIFGILLENINNPIRAQIWITSFENRSKL